MQSDSLTNDSYEQIIFGKQQLISCYSHVINFEN